MIRRFLLLLLFVFLFIPELSYAVYFASDTVYLYKDGKRIHDNALFLASYKSHSEACPDGECIIGQQFYPVTVHVPKEENLLTYAEFSSQNPYLGPKYGPEAGKAKDTWSAQNKQRYLSYLDLNTKDTSNFNPGPSEGGEGCGYPGCMGGRIGNNRTYIFDIATGEFSRTDHEVISTKNSIVYTLGASFLVIGIIFVAKKLFGNRYFIKK